MLLSRQYARTRTFCNPVSLNSTGTAVPVSGVRPPHILEDGYSSASEAGDRLLYGLK